MRSNQTDQKSKSKIIGKSPPKTWKGTYGCMGFFQNSKYRHKSLFFFLIDDLTRKSWVFFLKERSEIYQKIENWRAEIRLKTGEEAAIFRSDNAREYRKLEDAVRPQGIKMEYTTAYTPEKNEVAERLNRTLIQMARAMLLWAELFQKF